jgi:hypothetical protein
VKRLQHPGKGSNVTFAVGGVLRCIQASVAPNASEHMETASDRRHGGGHFL